MERAMEIYRFSNGDELHHYKKSLVICFKGPRKVLSTGPNNGGYRTDLQAVFNNDGNPGAGMACTMRADTYQEHMDLLAAEDLGLDPSRCTGLSTAASMDNVSIQTMEYEDFSVTAIVTGGIRVNGGRIGDPAVWHETSGICRQVQPGTINIILYIDADLAEGTLARALVSCTEAKTAAIQELLAPSRYSRGIATGSGTDGTIVVCNAQSPVCLTNAGKHSKLGEYIGKTVKKAVKEALYRQSGLGPAYQHNLINRMDRFGITEDTLWETYRDRHGKDPAALSRARFADRLDRLKGQDLLVTYSSLYAHLLDQLEWGLLNPSEAWEAGEQLLVLAGLMPADGESEEEPAHARDSFYRGEAEDSPEAHIVWMINRYREGLVGLIAREDKFLETVIKAYTAK